MAAPDPLATPDFDADQLTRQSRFVRRLALGLVSDADAADELTARTFAAALAQRPDTGPSFRAWLERVTWRLFRRDQRDRERRERRERAAAPAEALGATVDLVAEIDLQQQVARAFETLEEPSKSALFLRYFHDRTPTEIAAELRVPLGTVKSRLQRGLEQLRARLDAAHRGGREQWLAALVPWLSVGGPIVATKSKLVPIAVAATLVAGASLVVFEPWERLGAKDNVAANPSPAIVDEVAATTIADENPPRTAEPERALVTVDRASLPFATGRVVDAAGGPLADVAVVASRLARTRDPTPVGQQSGFDYAAIERDTLARTDSSGRFVVARSASKLDDLVAFWFVKPGFGLGQWWELSSERGANQDVHVVLEPAQPLRGTVLDSEGNPIANARVGIGVILDYIGQSHLTRVARNLPGAPQYLVPPAIGPQHGMADANGRFDLGCVPRGRSNASASADGYGYSALGGETPPDPWNPVLRRSDLLIDVVDVDTQEPIGDASAVIVSRGSGRVLTTAFSMMQGEADAKRRVGHRLNVRLGFGEGPVNQMGARSMQIPPWLADARDQKLDVELDVTADGYRSEVVELTLSTSEEPPHLRVELVPDDGSSGEASIAGRVVGAVDASGTASVEVRLHLFAPGWEAFTLRQAPPLKTTKVESDGSFAFRELRPARYLLVAVAKDCAPATLEIESPRSGVLLALHAAATIEVAVVDRGGRPVDGAVVHLQDESGKEARTRATKRGGIALFHAMPGGRLRALAFKIPDAEGYASFDLAQPLDAACFATQDFVDAPMGEVTRFELMLLEPIPVHLHFEHDDGTPITEVELQWRGMESGSPSLAIGTEFERLRSLKIDLDAHGDGVVELYPGSYRYQAAGRGHPRQIKIEVPRAVEASATIRLPDPGPTGALRGQLLDLESGLPVAFRDVSIIARPTKGEATSLGWKTTDPEGRFEFTGIPIGALDLRVHAGGMGGHGHNEIEDLESPYGTATLRTTIEADRTTTLQLALPAIKSKYSKLPTIPLDVVVTDATTGEPLANAIVELYALREGASLFAGSARTDFRGRASAYVFAAEKYTVDVSTPWDREVSPPAPPKYRGRTLEAEPQDARLGLEVNLLKRE